MLIEFTIIAAEAVIILGLLVMLVRQQVKGQYMDRRRLWGTPIILAVVGAIYIPLTVNGFVAADALLATLDVIVAVGVGLGLGALTTTHVANSPDRRGRLILIRSGWKGGALWIVFIAVRLGLQPLASAVNAHFINSVGVILILIAVARATMAVVVAPRLARASTAYDRRAAVPA